MKYAFPGKRTVSKEVRFDEKIGENVGYEITENVSGMTLREYYAGQALQGLLASGCRGSCTISSSKDAVRLADALIAELEGGGES